MPTCPFPCAESTSLHNHTLCLKFPLYPKGQVTGRAYLKEKHETISFVLSLPEASGVDGAEPTREGLSWPPDLSRNQ